MSNSLSKENQKLLNNVADELIANRETIINEIKVELDNIKKNLHNINPQNSMNSFNNLVLLMGIYSMSDFSDESIKRIKAELNKIRGTITEEVKEAIPKELKIGDVDGGGWNKKSKASRKKNRKY
jgi:vacuolar-type H+-ATPase subunit I/STV1